MRSGILLFSTFLLLLTSFQVSGQVTITRDDWPRMASFVDTIQASSSVNIPVPTEGPDQTWDYSFLELGEVNINVYTDATDNPAFPDALHFYNNDILLVLGEAEFFLPSNVYEAIDDESWYRTGREYLADFSVPLTPFTGGADDRIDYLSGNAPYQGRINFLEFPVNYQDQWEGSYFFEYPYNVTAAAYGLNQTPAFSRVTVNEQRTVAGYGTLTIPLSDGTSSPPMDVLLIKGDKVQIDSLFLGGSPAPEALLSVLGATQGLVKPDDFYLFYRPGFPRPILILEDLNPDGTLAGTATFRPRAADGVSAVRNLNIPLAKSFPNPLPTGSLLTITLEDTPGSGHVRLTDVQGRFLANLPYTASTGSTLQVRIPATIPAGMVLYLVTDEQMRPVGVGKLQVF